MNTLDIVSCSNKIRIAISDCDLSNREIAQKMECSPATILNWADKTKSNLPNILETIKLAKITGKSIEWFIGITPSEEVYTLREKVSILEKQVKAQQQQIYSLIEERAKIQGKNEFAEEIKDEIHKCHNLLINRIATKPQKPSTRSKNAPHSRGPLQSMGMEAR